MEFPQYHLDGLARVALMVTAEEAKLLHDLLDGLKGKVETAVDAADEGVKEAADAVDAEVDSALN